MSCSDQGAASFLRVETSVVCPTPCCLRQGDSGRHEVVINNRGPLAATFDVAAACQGSHLEYLPHRTKFWTTTVTVPAGLNPGDHKRRVWSDVELPNPTPLGPSGTQEDMRVDAVRYANPGGPRDKPVTLTVQLQLGP